MNQNIEAEEDKSNENMKGDINEETEDYLINQSQKNATPLVRQVLSSLGDAIIFTESNVQANRKIWDNYAKEWNMESDWVKKMAYHSRLTSVMLNQMNQENFAYINNSNSDMNLIIPQLKNIKLKYLGDEWSSDEDVMDILNDYIFPYITSDSICIEIGSGGGRICSRIINKITKLFCLDISKKMLEICQQKLLEVTHQNLKNTEFILLQCEEPNNVPIFPLHDQYDNQIDFIYSVDVFVHLDLHTQFNYFQQCYHLLNDNGYLFIHTSNLQSDLGWQRFSRQSHASVAGFYFVIPSMVDLLLEKAGFEIVRRNIDELNKKKNCANIYYSRDYLVIAKKKSKSN